MPRFSVCGIDCGKCRFRTEMNCAGCRENNGMMFWGKCDIFFAAAMIRNLATAVNVKTSPAKCSKVLPRQRIPKELII